MYSFFFSMTEINNSLFGLFRSETRIKILDLLIEEKLPLNFTEITKKTKTASSTLEYHLKQLKKEGLITHTNNQYSINAYSKIIWSNINSLNNLESKLLFLKTHKLPLENQKLLNDFIKIRVTHIPDMISLLTFMTSLNMENIEKMQMIGIFDLEMEEKMSNIIFSGKTDKVINQIDLIMTLDNFEELVSYHNFEKYYNMVNLDKLNAYLVKECNFTLSISEKFGMVYLPNLDGTIDYQQGLLFTSPKALKWLQKWYNLVKNKAKRIPFSRAIFKDKDSILKYINSLRE